MDSDLKLAEDLEWELFRHKPDASNGQQPWIVEYGLKSDVIGSDAFNRYIRIKQRDAGNARRFFERITKDSNTLLKVVIYWGTKLN